jgi:transcriptional regulator with XRE-family HTH domain
MNQHTGFGTALRAVRQSLGLSQAALAMELATPQRHVSFLETGRAAPTRAMVARIAMNLSLSAAQRAALFAASGFSAPYPMRDHQSEEITAALHMIERQILAHWPYPAFIIDKEWTILRHNSPAAQLLAPFARPVDGTFNMLEILLQPEFRSLVENWDEVSAGFYFRLHDAAHRSARVAAAFAMARARGDFDHIPNLLISQEQTPVFIPVRLRMAEGLVLSFTSLLGRFAAVQDALIESFDIELLVPVDDTSAMGLRACFG